MAPRPVASTDGLREKVRAAVSQEPAGQEVATIADQPAAVVAESPARPGLLAKIQYAKALADSGLLPAAYRKQPANVLYAIEYGEMLGLSPMTAITGVHVIDGKPSASAALISALVRRAGHKLRVTGTATSATCEIIRRDDPSYTFSVTFTMDDARAAGLLGKGVWKQYPSSMLKARAITQCARDACEEALFGLHYTAEELGAEVTEDGEVVMSPPEPAPVNPAREDKARREMFTWLMELFPDTGVEDLRAMISSFTGRPIQASTDLTLSEIEGLLEAIRHSLQESESPQDAARLFLEGCLSTTAAPEDGGEQAELTADA